MLCVGEIVVPLETVREVYQARLDAAVELCEEHKAKRKAAVAAWEVNWIERRQEMARLYSWITREYREMGLAADWSPPEMKVAEKLVEITLVRRLYDLFRHDLEASVEWRPDWEIEVKADQGVVIIRLKKPLEDALVVETETRLRELVQKRQAELREVPNVGRGLRITVNQAYILGIQFDRKEIEWRLEGVEY